MKIIYLTIFLSLLHSSLTYGCSNLGIFDQNNSEALGNDSLKRVFTFTKLIGEGAFGKIKKIRFAGRIVVVKELSLPKLHPEFHQMKQMVQKEIDIFALVGRGESRDYFPEFIDCVKDSSNKDSLIIWIIQESLETDFKKPGICDSFIDKFSPRERIEKYIGLMKGLKAIHDNGYAHEDLKPENVMSNDSEFSKLKIIDMGLAGKFTDIVMGGSVLYNSPEKVDKQPLCSSKHDIWALALTIASIETKNSFIFKGLSDTCFSTIFDSECHTQLFSNVNFAMSKIFGNESRFTNVIKRMISANPIDRPEIDEILSFLGEMNEVEKNSELMSSRKNIRKELKKNKQDIIPTFNKLQKRSYKNNVKGNLQREYKERKRREFNEKTVDEETIRMEEERLIQKTLNDRNVNGANFFKINIDKNDFYRNNEQPNDYDYNRKLHHNELNKAVLINYNKEQDLRLGENYKNKEIVKQQPIENNQNKKIVKQQPIENKKKQFMNNMYHKNRGYNPITGEEFLII